MNPGEGDAAEAQLVAHAQTGDARSFEMLFDRYYSMIYAFAYRACLGASEADDVAQETFIRAARGLRGFRGESSLRNWLYRIAHHVLTDRARQAIRRDQRDAGLLMAHQLAAEERPADFLRVHTALSQLPAQWREAVALVYFDDLSHAEAAHVLGCAETTVSWRIFRAKRVLKQLLEIGGRP